MRVTLEWDLANEAHVTRHGVPRAQIDDIARLPQIAGVKFTGTNSSELARAIFKHSGRQTVLSGVDEMFLASLLMGAHGAIGSFVNVVPEAFLDIYRLTEKGRSRLNEMTLHWNGVRDGVAVDPELHHQGAGGGADANVFNAFGVPTCVLGTGMRNIHTHQECITVDDLVKSAQWVEAIVRRVARGVQ